MNSKSILAVALISLVPFVGCSDGTEEQDVIEGPETSVADDGNQVVAPVIVDTDDPVTIEVGRAIDVTTDGVTRVDTSDDSVLEVSQPTDDGSAQFNAGATAKAAGTATLTVYDNDKVLYTVEVTVED
jgi:hypothetical protein